MLYKRSIRRQRSLRLLGFDQFRQTASILAHSPYVIIRKWSGAVHVFLRLFGFTGCLVLVLALSTTNVPKHTAALNS